MRAGRRPAGQVRIFEIWSSAGAAAGLRCISERHFTAFTGVVDVQSHASKSSVWAGFQVCDQLHLLTIWPHECANAVQDVDTLYKASINASPCACCPGACCVRLSWTGKSAIPQVKEALQATNFVLWSEAHRAELLSVPSAGWRRPFALQAARHCCFSAAVMRGNDVHVYTIWPGQAKLVGGQMHGDQHLWQQSTGANAQAPLEGCGAAGADSEGCGCEAACRQPAPFPGAALTVQAAHHGRETHAVVLLPLTRRCRAVVTASQDVSVRAVITRWASRQACVCALAMKCRCMGQQYHLSLPL